MSTPAPRPLGDIALSLSGGGYRAAAFHLGTLRMLHDAGLLGDVVGLSTVSGGTIAGVAWTVSLVDGRPFDAFEADFERWLAETNVIGEALDTLSEARPRHRHHWPSLIRSAADVYARPELLGDRRFAELLDARGLQLREAIFNATEFNHGLAFRFRRSDNPRARIGNGRLSVPRAVAAQVRLADVAAASSCFPGGFEPLVFPDQFKWTPDYPLERAREALGDRFHGGLALMDGGVYDNQGVDSLVLAFERSDATTLLISDVSVQNDPMYPAPRAPRRRGWVTLRGVKWAGVALFALAVGAAVVVGTHVAGGAAAGPLGVLDWLLYLFAGGLSLATAAGLLWLRGRLRDADALVRGTLRIDPWPALSRLTVVELVSMLVLRGGSLMALTSSVFMARVRRLVYAEVYRDEKYDSRRMTSLITGLTENLPKLFGRHPWLRPADDLRAYAAEASRMPTTLWWENAEQMGILVRAGTATTCFTLLRFIVETRTPAEYEDPTSPLGALYARLRASWAEIQAWPPPPRGAFPGPEAEMHPVPD
jgi:predicted acylesterase/phospholipase RssA